MVQRFGALGAMRTMMDVLREVSLDELREQAETTPRLLIVGRDAEEARRLGLALTGPEGQFASVFRSVSEPIESVGRIDAAVVWDPERTGAASRVSEALRYESPPVPVIRFDGTGTEDVEALERLRSDILKRIPDRAPAFGRALPAFKGAAAKQVIDETAAANAQFSLVSTIPTLLPIVGNFAAAGADFIVLTKNQVMMLFKLAAVYGRDLRDQREIIQEVIPVVGAGLLWRTIARQAVTWLPFAAGAIPKLAISYMGTMAVGRAAELYYRTGMKPTRAQLEQIVRQVAEFVRHLDLPGASRFLKSNGIDNRDSETPKLTVVREDDHKSGVGSGKLE